MRRRFDDWSLAEQIGPEAPADMFEVRRPEWQHAGACRTADPDLFFPGRGASSAPAKLICAGCPVRAECLEWALVHAERNGVWGGTAEKERRRMRRTARLENGPSFARTCVCGAAFMAVHQSEKYCGQDCRTSAQADASRRYEARVRA